MSLKDTIKFMGIWAC